MSRKQPNWVGRSLVVCVDGPKEGQWFLETEWNARVDSAERMVAKGQRRGNVLDYVRTTREVEHPHVDEAVGTALTYRPAR